MMHNLLICWKPPGHCIISVFTLSSVLPRSFNRQKISSRTNFNCDESAKKIIGDILTSIQRYTNAKWTLWKQLLVLTGCCKILEMCNLFCEHKILPRNRKKEEKCSEKEDFFSSVNWEDISFFFIEYEPF